ncbi:class F sortase [Blastococcus saxobsidens]|uniref:Sortase family enzyme n=1 Tax=Blastococcus saxobsidens (strain DD2) TaxID=1146883 RepID=H6RS86_BLASD|nr:class F sortase [Blastococcus saxobsidens]CCG05478.1 Sortase family enzyme [Blastococcus saxobsidens DD2]
MAKHVARADGRPRLARAAIAALSVGGASLIGVGLATQESVPIVPSAAAAPAPSSVTPSPAVPPSVPPPGPSSGVTAPQAPAPAPAVVGPVLPEAVPLSVTIPSIDTTTPPLASLGLLPDGSLEVPADYDVAGWYRGGPAPGELGPAVIAGHVDSAAEGPAVFFRLAELQPGDEIHVDRADGTTAVFAVDRVARYPKDAFPTVEVYGDTDHAALRLITCGGSFDPASGNYRDNVVVFARLAGVR